MALIILYHNFRQAHDSYFINKTSQHSIRNNYKNNHKNKLDWQTEMKAAAVRDNQGYAINREG